VGVALASRFDFRQAVLKLTLHRLSISFQFAHGVPRALFT